MKSKIFVIIIFVLFCIYPQYVVKATVYNGTSGFSTAASGGGGGSCNNRKLYCPYDNGNGGGIYVAYVAYIKNGNINELPESNRAFIYLEGNQSATWKKVWIPNAIKEAETRGWAIFRTSGDPKKPHPNETYFNNVFKKAIADKKIVEANKWLREEKNMENLLKKFGVDITKLTKSTFDSKTDGSGYGYRIVIEQMTHLYSNKGKNSNFLPIREVAEACENNKNCSPGLRNDNSSLYNSGNGALGGLATGLPRDLQLSWSDGGVKKNGENGCKGFSLKTYKSKSCGIGYHFIDIPQATLGKNSDYSIDAACDNCDSTNDKGSYIVQDTTDWDSILASKNSEIENAKKYYPKKIGNCTVYCREEYKVTFPNANDKITTEAGRFFTINKLGTAIYANGIPNYKQIKVEKVRECRAQDSGQKACLKSFANSAKTRTGNAAGSTGTIKLTYKENYKNSKYNQTITLEENKNRTITKDEYIESTVGTSTVMLKSTVTKYYELPEDTYRWVNQRDGVSSLKKPANNVIDHYLDLETSNLPISNGNYATKENKGIAGTVTLNYSLPTNSEDPYTLIKKAFNSKNDYFLDPTSKPSDNLYKKQKDNKLNAEEKTQIKQSACAKLYGYGTNKFNTCVAERTTNKAGKCYTQITGENKYICDIDVCPKGEMLVQKCENGKTKLVCSKEQTLNEECPGDKTCKVENGKYYGQQGIEVSKEKYLKECPCKKENNKYYIGEVEVLKADYEKVCPPDNDNSCKLCNGGKCCEDLDMVCPDEMGECPGRGNTIIYRTIDLKNPFPGQTNYQRQTGANWCSYNTKTGKVNCKNTNNVATTHIQNNRKNKDESVYDLTPLYEVDLNSTNMKAIRKYNKEGDHKYDDFTLTCDKGTCKSTFLRDSKYSLNLSGVCNTANYNDLRVCSEISK